MYAILQHGGRQYRVGPGDRLLLDRLDAEPGQVVGLQPVLFVNRGDEGSAGSGESGATVAATVVSHLRGEKLRVFRYKAKKRYRRTLGYRSQLTELRVESVLAAGEPLPGAPATRSAKKPSRPKRVAKAAASTEPPETEAAGDGS